MARRPDIPCAGDCGRLLWSGKTSLPAGQATCRPCRKRLPSALNERTCPVCSVTFKPSDKTVESCSRSCSEVMKALRAGKIPGHKRVCPVCSETYQYKASRQRTCGHVCGVELRRREGTLPAIAPPSPICKVHFLTCSVCCDLYASRDCEAP